MPYLAKSLAKAFQASGYEIRAGLPCPGAIHDPTVCKESGLQTC